MILNRAVSVYLNRRLLSVLFLGFSSGLPLALTGSTLSVWLTEGGVSKTSIGLFALAGIPYTLKFAWAPLIDRLRLPVITARLGRRRGWAVVTQILLVLCLLGLGASDPALDLGWTAALALAVSFCSASQDVVIDAFRVELLAEEQQGAGAGAVVLGYRAGMMASGAGALYLANFMPWGTVYTVMAAMVAVGTATILANREPSEPSTPESRAIERAAAAYAEAHPLLSGRKAALIAWLYSAVAAPFAQFMTRPAWLAILAFIALYKLGDAYAGIMTQTFYLGLGFSKIEIANITKVIGLWATVAGGLAGGMLVARAGTVRALLVCGLLQMASNLMFVALASKGHDLGWLAGAVLIENVAGGMGTAALVAYLSVLCNPAYTATQYALLSSVAAVGRDLIAASSGWTAEQMGWPGFFLFSAALALPALLLLPWLKGGTSQAPARTAEEAGPA